MSFYPVAKEQRKNIFIYDYWLLICAASILAFGLLLLASASINISVHQYHTPFHFFFRQVIFIVAGILISITLLKTPIELWEKVGGYVLILTFLLLIIVLVPGIGREINGSTRWIGVGPLTLQVSELAKFGMVTYLAGYLVRRQIEVQNTFEGFFKPLIIMGIMASLLLLEPDFGATVVIMFVMMGMVFLAGARLWQFFILFSIVAFLLWLIAVSSPYRLERITSFLNPWATPFDSGYQLTQSLIAFGRGGIFGVGLGNGVQKLFYLPEVHTDFLFAVLAEELGIFGQFFVLALFACLVGRALYIGRLAEKAKQLFSAYLAYGLGLLFGLQVIINVGVNTGLLPTKGLTLPLMSYGGSSVIFSTAMVAILLRIYYEVKVEETA